MAYSSRRPGLLYNADLSTRCRSIRRFNRLARFLAGSQVFDEPAHERRKQNFVRFRVNRRVAVYFVQDHAVDAGMIPTPGCRLAKLLHRLLRRG